MRRHAAEEAAHALDPVLGSCGATMRIIRIITGLMAEAAGDPGVRPGMVVVPQSFGSSVNAHPHVHAIASRGAWTRDGTWVPVPYIDAGAAARLFRHQVLRLLLDAELIEEDRVEMILGWRHTSGFSVHNEVVVQADDGNGLERLARYLALPLATLDPTLREFPGAAPRGVRL